MLASEREAVAPATRRALEFVRDVAKQAVDEVVDLTAEIAATPAPTGAEQERAYLVASLFRRHGVDDVSLDSLGNVVARVQGESNGAALLLAGHTDTVFPAGTTIKVRRDARQLAGPGVGDNSLGIAAIILLPELLRRIGAVPPVDLLLTGNVGEEGNGNLRGIRAVLDELPEVGAAIAVEGHNLGRVTHVAVGSRRLRVRVTGPGGHSWGDFGRANAIYAAAEIIHELARLPISQSPKTTLSVGTIEGGISINTIPPTCTFDIDTRSVSATGLSRLSERVDRILGAPRPGVTVNPEVIGERPAGVVPLESPIVRFAVDALSALGLPATADASSTDANIPISRGIPSVCIGLTSGGNVHREDEYIDLAPLGDGLTQLITLTLTTAESLAAGTL